MKIRCKCGRALMLSMEKHAGRKVACKECGQRYRLPAAKPRNKTIQMEAWKDDKKEHDPKEVGAVPLGESLSLAWLLMSTIITLVITIGGSKVISIGLEGALSKPEIEKYVHYVTYALLWAPTLAFVIAGWVSARLSPGRTIVEPALGAALAIAVLFSVQQLDPAPLQSLMGAVPVTMPQMEGTFALKANAFALELFKYACLSCAGAYFGEVAQEKANV